MANPTNYYVDPAIAGNSGTGSIGDPFGDLQYALNAVSRDGTNGDQFNIKAGADEVLAAALSLTTYGTPTQAAPLTFRGYTATANDGGQGGISGAGAYSMIGPTSLDFINFVDMHLHNSGSAAIVQLDDFNQLINCEVNNTSGNGVVLDAANKVTSCQFYDIGGIGLAAVSGTVIFNTFKNHTKSFTYAVAVSSTATVLFNQISISGASNGIFLNGSTNVIMFNNVYSVSGTGAAIWNNNAAHAAMVIINNTVEGFSGVGGMGIIIVGQTDLYGYNAVYNCTTPYTVGDVICDLGNNDTLLASPFTDAANDDFDPIAGLFASYPSYPTSWNGMPLMQQNLLRMATQYAASTGGGRRNRARYHGV